MSIFQSGDQRRSKRESQSATMFWRSEATGSYEMGWLLESSDEGCAFAWRGSDVPQCGTAIDIQLDATTPGECSRKAIIRRTHIAHDDLVVIAAELRDEEAPTQAVVKAKVPQKRSKLSVMTRGILTPSPAPPGAVPGRDA